MARGREVSRAAAARPSASQACPESQKIIVGEFTLVLDSHHRFVRGWDTALESMYRQLEAVGSPKPLLTAYLPAYDPARESEDRFAVALGRLERGTYLPTTAQRALGFAADDGYAAGAGCSCGAVSGDGTTLSRYHLAGCDDTALSTDDMAERCGVNKRMIYYYYGSKEGLYLAALEAVFDNLVAHEREIKIEDLDPAVAIETIINIKIDYYLENPHFVSFLSMENFYKARHLRKSKKLASFRGTLTDLITGILKRGQRSGQFRADVEPVDFYVSMCALCIMYFSNQHTFGVIFEREMMTRANLERRRRTVIAARSRRRGRSRR